MNPVCSRWASGARPQCDSVCDTQALLLAFAWWSSCQISRRPLHSCSHRVLLFPSQISPFGFKLKLSALHSNASLPPSLPLQSAYLVQSLSRMTEAINAILPPGTVRGFIPSGADVAGRLVARIVEEMEAVGEHPRLLQLVLKNAGKALQMLAERCEYQVGPLGAWHRVGLSPSRMACVRAGAIRFQAEVAHWSTRQVTAGRG